MSWRLVEGVPLPDAVGGHPALDFCNTRAGWGDPAPKEYLTGPHVLAALGARDTGLVPADRFRRGAAGARGGRARTPSRAPSPLREALYACALRRGTPADWELVSAEAARRAQPRRARARRGRRPARLARAPRGRARRRRAAAVAAAAEDLLTSSALRRSSPPARARGAAGCSPTGGASGAGARWPHAATGPRRAGTRSVGGEWRGLGRPCPRAHIGRRRTPGV